MKLKVCFIFESEMELWIRVETLIDYWLSICNHLDLPYYHAKIYLDQIEKLDLNQARSGFLYWKRKFDRLEKCQSIDQLELIYQEWLFTDDLKERLEFCNSPFDLIQIVMRMTINASRNKLLELRKDKKYHDPLGYFLYNLCLKHGTSIEILLKHHL